MVDNLPVIKANQGLALDKPASSSLLGRGLAAIQQTQIAIADQDKRYRQARDIYDQITDFGEEAYRFYPDLLPKQGRQIDIFEGYETSEIQPWIDKTNQLTQIFRDLKQLADEGYGKAYFLLGQMYRGGQGIVKDADKREHYQNLAYQWYFNHRLSNDPEIMRDLGWMYARGYGVEHDDTQAVYWYNKAAEQGHSGAQYNLGWMYGHGDDFEDEDKDEDSEQAVYWYRQAAEQGHASAQLSLGSMYRHGDGVEQDDEQAVYWFTKAAEQGHSGAQYNLGLMYGNGDDFEDEEQAAYWYKQAAEQGHTSAQDNLGRMYVKGHGVEQSDEQAVFWFQQATDCLKVAMSGVIVVRGPGTNLERLNRMIAHLRKNN